MKLVLTIPVDASVTNATVAMTLLQGMDYNTLRGCIGRADAMLLDDDDAFIDGSMDDDDDDCDDGPDKWECGYHSGYTDGVNKMSRYTFAESTDHVYITGYDEGFDQAGRDISND